MKKHLSSRAIVIMSIYILFITVMITVHSTQSRAESKGNIEQLSIDDSNKFVESIVLDIIAGKPNNTSKVKNLFTKEAYDKITYYIENNRILGEISEKTIDYSYPTNNSTSDTVIMGNFKLEQQFYSNELFLIELHVNKDGIIYGFNTWLY